MELTAFADGRARAVICGNVPGNLALSARNLTLAAWNAANVQGMLQIAAEYLRLEDPVARADALQIRWFCSEVPEI